ncbi:MAG TPA: ATP-binding protein [Kofleriaceae bacterium]
MARSDRATNSADEVKLSDFVHAHREEIVSAWMKTVRDLPKARDLDRLALIDHIPELLDHIARMADELAEGRSPHLPNDVAEVHAIERLGEGFDLPQVVLEFTVLRDCLTRLWEQHLLGPERLLETRLLDKAIDRAVAASIDRYTKARDRTLQSLDRIANAALESKSLDEFLGKLLRVLVETTASVDTASILVREGDVLYVRASVGLEEEVQQGVTQKIGEGFAGTIALTRQPLAVRDASTDPIVIRPAIREAKIRGLYGVPLHDDGDVIAVAHMGSRTAYEFSEQDKRLFAAMAYRATAAIFQHLLREIAERNAEQLTKAVEAREEVLAIVSHDLRNPLGAIDMGASNLLREAGISPTARKQIDVIRRSAVRMERLIDDLLDMSAIRAGHLPLEVRSEDSARLVADVVDTHAMMAEEKGIKITGECDACRLVSCDRQRIEQVFGNLIGNAIKYCSPGDVILVRGEMLAGNARFSVADTGPGISQNEMERLFSPYAAAKRHSVKLGTGLGLYIAKGIVEAHGGKLWADSTPGQGATFYFTLPAAASV